MSVVTAISKRSSTVAATREKDEFDGLWINPGLHFGDEKDAKWVRLPRGIAVSDLKPRKIYESMDPEFAAEAAMMNQVIAQIQQKALTLAEGESMPINLELRLYRRQEEADVTTDKATEADLSKALFG